MKSNHPTNDEIIRAMRGWFPAYSTLALGAEDDQLRALKILGLPRRGERAGDWHRAFRSRLRAWCDETSGLFELKEEPEGRGLDYVICYLIPGKPFIIRWGRFNGRVVKRNDSIRQSGARSSGVLSSEFLIDGVDDPKVGDLRQVTVAYTMKNEGTRGGVPAWFMERLLLLQEQFDGVEHLAEIDRYKSPEIAEDARRAVAVPNESELREWRRQIRAAKKTG